MQFNRVSEKNNPTCVGIELKPIGVFKKGFT